MQCDIIIEVISYHLCHFLLKTGHRFHMHSKGEVTQESDSSEGHHSMCSLQSSKMPQIIVLVWRILEHYREKELNATSGLNANITEIGKQAKGNML